MGIDGIAKAMLQAEKLSTELKDLMSKYLGREITDEVKEEIRADINEFRKRNDYCETAQSLASMALDGEKRPISRMMKTPFTEEMVSLYEVTINGVSSSLTRRVAVITPSSPGIEEIVKLAFGERSTTRMSSHESVDIKHLGTAHLCK